VTGSLVMMTGKRRDCEVLITIHDARSAAVVVPLAPRVGMRP
jgi:hypothetical protein